jgi:hypothetical protein
MNGTISVKSQKGVGSTFSFVALTRRTNNIPPDNFGPSPSSPTPQHETSGSVELVGANRRVLIVKTIC